MLDLRVIAKALVGEVSGRQVLCPGPGHSTRDRSLAVRVSPDAPDGFVVHSFCGDDWRACRDYVRERLGLPDGFKAPTQARPLRALADDEKLFRARHLWSCRSSELEPVQAYLRVRGCQGAVPNTIGYLPAGAYPHHAMIAAFGLTDEPEPGIVRVHEVRGIHLTFLKPNGSGKADIERPKIMLGPSNGWPIVIAPPNNMLALAITEGIEDGLTVHQATGLGVWVAGAAGRMPALADRMPSYVETATIYQDADSAGQRGARQLADALLDRGFEVYVEGGAA